MSRKQGAELCFYSIYKKRGINILVPWFMLLSWLYYHQDCSLVSDACFDWIGRELNKNWDKVRHVHKRRITRPGVPTSAISGYDINFNLPGSDRIKRSALQLIKEFGEYQSPARVPKKNKNER